MASAETWRARAVAWKESGKRSEDFCREHGLNAGALRSWTSKLGLSEPRNLVRGNSKKFIPRLARVIPHSCEENQSTVATEKTPASSGIAIYFGKARIDVSVEHNNSTLRSVLQILQGLPS